MKGRRRVAASSGALLAVVLAACAPALPETVVPGTEITAGWTGELTSVNAAASPTAGNIDIAEMIRGDFGDVIDGEFVADESFGKITVVSDDPFTVLYDLAEPTWSDGVPLDAADLLLGWAGAAGYFDEEDGGGAADIAGDVPIVDEFARSIRVIFPEPSNLWQQAVSVPVPAHVLGAGAFGIDDVMEAKQAVIRAIQQSDQTALSELAAVWNGGFELGEKTDLSADLTISSGPFMLSEVAVAGEGQSVALVPNASYRGAVTPAVARIELVPRGDDPLSAVRDRLDVVQVAPLASDQSAIHDLEREDFTVSTTDDGTMWSMLLEPSGVFIRDAARVAFLHAAQANAMVQGGGGPWASAYTVTTSMTTAPGSRAYDVVDEDSGFTQALGSTDAEPAEDRRAAGLPDGTPVCVLYDRTSEFAVGAFAALREAAAQSGWSIVDCGSDDINAAADGGGWDAMIIRTPIPRSPQDIADQWGGAGDGPMIGTADSERDALIAQLAQTADVYAAREVRAQIEATIVRAAIAMPLATNPQLTIVSRGVTGVSPRSGGLAPLTYGAAQWAVAP